MILSALMNIAEAVHSIPRFLILILLGSEHNNIE